MCTSNIDITKRKSEGQEKTINFFLLGFSLFHADFIQTCGFLQTQGEIPRLFRDLGEICFIRTFSWFNFFDIISDRKIQNREIIKKKLDIYAINKEIRISSYSIANLYSEMKLFSIATYSGRRRDWNSFKTVLNYA